MKLVQIGCGSNVVVCLPHATFGLELTSMPAPAILATFDIHQYPKQHQLPSAIRKNRKMRINQFQCAFQ